MADNNNPIKYSDLVSPDSSITDLIKQTGKKLLTDVTVFDVYEGANIGDGKKSIAISLTFQDPEKTLETADVDKKVNSIVVRLERELNCTLRS